MENIFRENWKREAKRLEDEAIVKSQWESYVTCDRFHALTDKKSISLGVRRFLSKVGEEEDFCSDPTMQKVTKEVVSRGYGLMKHVEAYMWRSDEMSQRQFSDQIRSIRDSVNQGMNRTLGHVLSHPDTLINSNGHSTSTSSVVSLNKKKTEFLQSFKTTESASSSCEEPLLECATWIALKPKGFRPHKISFNERICKMTPEVVLPKSIGLLKCALRAIRSNFGDLGRANEKVKYSPVGVRCVFSNTRESPVDVIIRAISFTKRFINIVSLTHSITHSYHKEYIHITTYSQRCPSNSLLYRILRKK